MYFFFKIIWFLQQDTLLLLDPLERATKYLSASSYPTMGDTRLVFLGLQTHLDKYMKDNNFSQRTMAALIYHKIEDYWMIIDSASTASAILDPRSKFSVFPHELQSSACAHIQSIYELYKGRFSPTNPVLPNPVFLLKRIIDSISRNSDKQTKTRFPLQSQKQKQS